MLAITDELEPGDWMMSVAELLPVPHREPAPFTLGEAVAELGLWASTARTESWENARNRTSLEDGIRTGLASVGPRLRAAVSDLLPTLVARGDRQTIAAVATEFAERWREPSSIDAAFRDLCEAAASNSCSNWDLKPQAETLASQLGEVHRGWGALNTASTMLAGEPHSFDLERWVGPGATLDDLSPRVRIAAAQKVLTSDPSNGRVVVWLLYRRAQVNGRVAAGPITFLRADWAIPNATRDDGQEFAERDELRALVEGHLFIKEEELFTDEAAKEQYVLARVDLGQRNAAGAASEAAQHVDALVSIAVEAGGVSWINTGTSSTLVDGRGGTGSFGSVHAPRRDALHDGYGISVTSDLLDHWAGLLGNALSSGPMPAFLVEALSAVRDASMIEHRDVLFYDARPVTPRVAVALEDHAIELVASLASMKPDDLISALQEEEVDRQADQLVLNAVLTPVYEGYSLLQAGNEAESIAREISHLDRDGARVVSLEKVWRSRERIQALSMSPAARFTLERALDAISSTADEAVVRERAQESVAAVRIRHRRVRNAITHGNPVSPITIGSVRKFSERMAREALAIALQSYATGETIPELLDNRKSDREAEHEARTNGVSKLDRIVGPNGTSASH